MPDHDSASPDDLRRASRDSGARARALDGGVRQVRLASSAFGSAGGALVGAAGDRYRNTIAALQQAFADARAAHEQVADALQRVADPIEEEQDARKVLDRARERLAEARDRLAAEQARVVAMEQAAATPRMGMGGELPHVDRSGLEQARRAVEEAEQAERRAARRHQDAERDRERAVRAFAAACQAAASLAPAPAAPGAPGSVSLNGHFGPKLADELMSGKRSRDLGRRTGGSGLTEQERRRLARNGLSPRDPLFDVLGGSVALRRALLDEGTRTRGRFGDAGARFGLGERRFKAEGGLGRVGAHRYGVRGDVGAEGYAFDGDAHAHGRLGPTDGRAGAHARVGGGEARGGLDVNAGRDGARVRAEAEAFAGAKAGVDAEAGALGAKGHGGVEGQAGIGGSAGVDAGVDKGKLRVQANLGAALGLGLKVKAGFEVDAPKVVRHVGDGAEAVKDGVGGAIKTVGGLFD